MAEVTGYTAEHMAELVAQFEGMQIDGASLNGAGHLILTKGDGSTIDAGQAAGDPQSVAIVGGHLIYTHWDGSTSDLGNVQGAPGAAGPPSSVDIHAQTEMGAALVDADELLAYDASASAIRKSLTSRVWDYVIAKLAATQGTTLAELGFVHGVTSAIQTQINDAARLLSGTPSATVMNNIKTWLAANGGSVAAATVVDFDASGTFNPANYPGASGIEVYAWGGGSAGSASSTFNAAFGGGGGGCSYTKLSFPTTSVPVTVGAGAASGTTINGGDSSFGAGVLIARGGTGLNGTGAGVDAPHTPAGLGFSGGGGSTAAAATGASYINGTAVTAPTLGQPSGFTGGPGGSNTSFNTGGSSVFGGGGGAAASASGTNLGGTSSAGGAGGSSVVNQNGSAGSVPGGGGAGALTPYAAGAGAHGRVRVIVHYS